ncbi:VanZ family protein [Catenovulum sediminis]
MYKYQIINLVMQSIFKILRLQVSWQFITTVAFIYASFLFFKPINTNAVVLFPHFDKLAHFVVFAGLTFLTVMSFHKNRNFHAAAIILTMAFYGAGVEIIQGTFFDRQASLADWLFDMAGCITSIYIFNNTKFSCLLSWVVAR